MSSHNTMAKYKNFDPKHSFYRREPLHRASERILSGGTKTDIGAKWQGQGRKLGEDPKKRPSSEIRPVFCQKLGEDQTRKSFCRKSGQLLRVCTRKSAGETT